MKLRTAKRILREYPHGPRAYNPGTLRVSTWQKAYRRIQAWSIRALQHNEWRTPGWRIGKWDPARPIPPWELPF